MTSLLLSLAVSFDGLGVGLSYNLRRVTFTPRSLFIICLLSSIAVDVGMRWGGHAATLINLSIAKAIGALIFMLLGLWILLESWLLRDPDSMDTNHSGVIDVGESAALGLVMALDAMGIGVAVGMTGTVLPELPLLVGLVKLACIKAGEHVGPRIARLLRGRLAVLPAVILIVMGLAKAWGV